MSDKEQDLQRVDAALEALGEHFDCVQIFVTRHEPEIEDGTISIHKGSGNWFTRYGKVKEWCVKEEARMKKEIFNEA